MHYVAGSLNQIFSQKKITSQQKYKITPSNIKEKYA